MKKEMTGGNMPGRKVKKKSKKDRNIGLRDKKEGIEIG